MHVKVTSDINQAIRNFRFKCDQAALFDELKARRYYSKPSLKRRKKKFLKKLLSGDKSLEAKRRQLAIKQNHGHRN